MGFLHLNVIINKSCLNEELRIKKSSDLLEVKSSSSLQFCSPTQELICPSIHILLLTEVHEIYSSFISQVNKDILDILHVALSMILFTSDSQMNTVFFTPKFSVYLPSFILFLFSLHSWGFLDLYPCCRNVCFMQDKYVNKLKGRDRWNNFCDI